MAQPPLAVDQPRPAMAADVGKGAHLAVVAANDDHALAEIIEAAPLARLGDVAVMAHHLRRGAQERALLGLEKFVVMVKPAGQAHPVERIGAGIDAVERGRHAACTCHFNGFAAMARQLGDGIRFRRSAYLRRQPEGRSHGAASAIGQQDENVMPLYEHVFLARQDLAQAQVDALAENATKIITDHGGSVVKTETWGLRGLAYRIAKNRKAHYVMLDIDAPRAGALPSSSARPASTKTSFAT